MSLLYVLSSSHENVPASPTSSPTVTESELQVAHGLILRCFVKRWLGLSIDATLPMVFAPGAFAILRYVYL
jgi:hypothetical protein